MQIIGLDLSKTRSQTKDSKESSVSGLDTSGLVLPSITQDPCQSLGTRSSFLTRGSKGGIPLSESKAGFIPPVVNQSAKSGADNDLKNTQPLEVDAAKEKKK